MAARGGELVVGAAAHDLRAKLRNRPIVQHGAERAGREHVRRLRVDRIGLDRHGAQGLHRQSRARRVEIGHDQGGAGRGELTAQRQAHVAQALNRDPQALQISAAERVGHRGADRLEHAAGGDRQRLPGGQRGGCGVRRHPRMMRRSSRVVPMSSAMM